MGLFVEVMGRDCTAGGATSGKQNAVLVSAEGPFDPKPELPGLVLVEDNSGRMGPGYVMVRRNAGGVFRVRAVPVNDDGSPKVGGMFGGHFVWSQDSRFPYDAPVPVFDRFEF